MPIENIKRNNIQEDPVAQSKKGCPYCHPATAAPLPPAVTSPTKPMGVEATPINFYYTDTISRAGEEVCFVEVPQNIQSISEQEQRPLIEVRFEEISSSIDDELQKHDIDFEKLQNLVYKIVMLLMRQSAKGHQEYILEVRPKIEAQAIKIQGTYNRWPGLVLTVISAGVSIGSGFAGLTPLAPGLVSSSTANILQGAATPLSTSGTAIQSLASIPNNTSEGERGVLQAYLKEFEGKLEDTKGAKQGKNQNLEAVRSAWLEFLRTIAETNRAMTNG